jgi:hypothetical protein
VVKRKMRNGRGKDNEREREERVIREDERAKEEQLKMKRPGDGGGLAVQPCSGNTAPAGMDTAKAWTHSVRAMLGALRKGGERRGAVERSKKD